MGMVVTTTQRTRGNHQHPNLKSLLPSACQAAPHTLACSSLRASLLPPHHAHHSWKAFPIPLAPSSSASPRLPAPAPQLHPFPPAIIIINMPGRLEIGCRAGAGSWTQARTRHRGTDESSGSSYRIPSPGPLPSTVLCQGSNLKLLELGVPAAKQQVGDIWGLNAGGDVGMMWGCSPCLAGRAGWSWAARTGEAGVCHHPATLVAYPSLPVLQHEMLINSLGFPSQQAPRFPLLWGKQEGPPSALCTTAPGMGRAMGKHITPSILLLGAGLQHWEPQVPGRLLAGETGWDPSSPCSQARFSHLLRSHQHKGRRARG